jgi:hypothetical protein
MNSRIMRSFGIAMACLGLTATAVVADDSAEEQSTRGAASESFASRVAVGYRINPVEFEEFEHLMRTGQDDGEILQVMPWNVYGKMTRLDLRAIYEYLSAIPPLPDNPEPGP